METYSIKSVTTPAIQSDQEQPRYKHLRTRANCNGKELNLIIGRRVPREQPTVFSEYKAVPFNTSKYPAVTWLRKTWARIIVFLKY